MQFRLLKTHLIDLLQVRYDSREAEAIFYRIAEHFTGIERKKSFLMQDNEIAEKLVQDMAIACKRIVAGEPTQYVIQHEWFYGRQFEVSPAVLIPRGETEELVEWVFAYYKGQNTHPYILDIGTGSGCIAISIALELDKVKVAAMDYSKEALAIARKNAADLGAKVTFFEGDILDTTSFETPIKWDCIVSNPPYIPQKESAEMAEHVLAHEPHLALFVPNEQPLLFYDKIADYALHNLTEKGTLFFEVHAPFALNVVALLQAKGFSEIELRADIHGRQRMVKAILLRNRE